MSIETSATGRIIGIPAARPATRLRHWPTPRPAAVLASVTSDRPCRGGSDPALSARTRAVGPILIFDKSGLQGLSLDECVTLDSLFLTNIVPVFYVETLADLDKVDKKGRAPGEVVADIAGKSPSVLATSSLVTVQLIPAFRRPAAAW